MIADSLLTLGEYIDNVPSCNFLSEQIFLLCCKPHARTYSIDVKISAFSVFHRSRACYIELQKILTLPSICLLKGTSSTGNLSLLFKEQSRLFRSQRIIRKHSIR